MISKIGMFTDIHFGRRGNERTHNQDCVDHINWFCNEVKREKPSHIAFLGDWFESRNAINIETLHYSYKGLKALDALNLPVYFVVGNHDLHRRHTRDVHSVSIFQELKNFTVVDHPTVIDGCLFSPFLFDHEYPNLAQYNTLPAWFGHFEFKGFAITGYGTALEHGPDHTMFKGPKKIFSGHFHKRQIMDNVCYIGNAFPMDMGDAGDDARGCAFYTPATDKVDFFNWGDAPSYLKVNLENVLEDKWEPKAKMKVKCTLNDEITYSQAEELREALIKDHKLRDFILEENRELKQVILEGTEKVDEITETMFDSIDGLVVSQLKAAKDDPLFKGTYDVDTLIDMYESLVIVEKEGEEV